MDIVNSFESFHNKNTRVYTEFARLAKAEIKKGATRLSARKLIEQIRRNKKIRTSTMRTGKVKIDNNYISLYARLFMQLNPEHEGIFQVRSMKHAPDHISNIGL